MTPIPKPEPLADVRKRRRAALEAQERAVRLAVQKRDRGQCRVPWCRERGELAHLEPKGAGGDHGERTTTANCALVCHGHHRGYRSLHSGDLRYEFLEPERGADGPIRWSWANGTAIGVTG